MSWRPMVKVAGESKFCGNGLRFATKVEALASAENLMMRWMLVEAFSAEESEDPVNYVWGKEKGLIAVK